jgi:hypothetical protein
MGEDNLLFVCEGRRGTFIIRWRWNNGMLLGEPFVAGTGWLRPIPDDNEDRETGHEFASRKRASRKKRQSPKIGTLSTIPWISELEINRQSLPFSELSVRSKDHHWKFLNKQMVQ